MAAWRHLFDWMSVAGTYVPAFFLYGVMAALTGNFTQGCADA
jgi:cytochrome bd-type quinol oxidase subunit 2